MDLYLPQLSDSNVLIPLPEKDDVYNTALSLRPEIEAGKLNVESSDLSIKMARAGYLPTLNLSARHRKHECQRQRLQLQRTGQAELEQLAGTDPQHPHLRQAADEKLHQQGQAAKADQPAGPAGQQEDTLQNYRKPLAGRQQRTTAIRGSFTEVEEHGNQLLSRQRTIQRRHEKYSRIAHGKNNLLSAQQETLQAKYTAILNAGLLRFYQGEEINLF